MQSGRINFNVEKTAFAVLEMDDVRGDLLCRCFVCSRIICLANLALTRVSSFSILYLLSDILHNRVSAIIAVLYVLRPRAPS
ncbi:MAG: hypothetical protein OXI63_23665 [Candidatus Poribacteria bacterium]|nr:hypothetical protein [Candidatus Poribacteria bacterium]